MTRVSRPAPVILDISPPDAPGRMVNEWAGILVPDCEQLPLGCRRHVARGNTPAYC